MSPKANDRGRGRGRGWRSRAIGRERTVAPPPRLLGNNGELVHTTTTQDGTIIDVRRANILTFPAEASK